MTNAMWHLLQLPPERCIMTGDRLETDMLMGLNAGMATALTLTGAATLQEAQASPIKPHFILNDLGDLLPETSYET
jgi:ribonucleotide monophosphatase NagD (HAD superfamily)